VFRQVANPASEREQAPKVGWGMFPEPADVICRQQRANGDITLRTDEEVGEPEPEKSGQGKAVSCFSVVGIVRGLSKLQEPFVT